MQSNDVQTPDLGKRTPYAQAFARILTGHPW